MENKYIFVVLGILALASITLKMVRSQPRDHWQFRDKTGVFVTIERITSGDLSDNKHVFIDAFKTLYQEHPEVMAQALEKFKTVDAFLIWAFEEYEMKEFAAKKPDSYFVHAVRRGLPVGYMSFDVKDHRAFIRNLAIAPVCKGTGIGAELTRGVFKIRPDVKQAWLMVSRANPGAVGFYKHLGFVENAAIAPQEMDQKTWAALELSA